MYRDTHADIHKETLAHMDVHLFTHSFLWAYLLHRCTQQLFFAIA